MRLLVLGGTQHVGRAVVSEALDRGFEVTTVTRGVSGEPPDGVDARRADRRTPGDLRSAIANDEWDAVVDTWSMEPRVVLESARLLSSRVGHYTYISSRSVYTWPLTPGSDEHAPVVDGDPESDKPDAGATVDYAADKRGGELGVLTGFDGPSLLARAGLILGPWEVVGRLPWWLRRIARGGRIPAPGPVDRPLQFIDARDLAVFALNSPIGVHNTVSRVGHATIGSLLSACVDVTGSDAELVWLTPEQVSRASVAGWTELPIWVPPTGELAGLHDCSVESAYTSGLRCRPMEETVRDTWAWLEADNPGLVTGRAGSLGVTPDQEAALLS